MSRWDDLAYRWKEFKYQWRDFASRWGDFGNSPAGKGTLIGGIVVAACVILYSLLNFFSSPPALELSREGTFIDATTGRVFQYEIQMGSKIPVPAPSGKNTGYPAEMCFWTKDGKQRSTPFPVLLNQYAGKPEPTFCPDCGRKVLPKNPPPMPGQAPPPTQAEDEQQERQKRGARGES